MNEYIEREKVMKTAKNGNHSDFGRSIADLTSLREVLEDIPSADVIEVKHGEWTTYGIAAVCSVCQTEIVIEQYEKELNYCPNCGAKMDGKAVDENE